MLNDKYNPKDFEDKLYEHWEKEGYFKPSMDKTKDIILYGFQEVTMLQSQQK